MRPSLLAHRILTATRQKRAGSACSTHGPLFATDDAVRSDERDWLLPLPLPPRPPTAAHRPQPPTLQRPASDQSRAREARAWGSNSGRPRGARADLDARLRRILIDQPSSSVVSPHDRRTRGPVEHGAREKHSGARRGRVVLWPASFTQGHARALRGQDSRFSDPAQARGGNNSRAGSSGRRMGHPRARWCLSPSYRRGAASDP